MLSNEVSIYQNCKRTKPSAIVEWQAVINEIQSDRHRQKTEVLRALESKEDRRAGKEQHFAAATFSGVFPGRHTIDGLKTPTGFLIPDLDHLTGNGVDLAAFRDQLRQDGHVWFAFASPSGDGIKCAIRADGIRNDADHKVFFKAVQRYFIDVYGIEIDPACSDISRLTFIPCDPDAWVNQDAILFNIEQWSRTESTEERFHHQAGSGSPGAQSTLDYACRTIAESTPGSQHHTRLRMSRLVGGLIPKHLSRPEALAALENAVRRSGAEDMRAAMQTIEWGLDQGMKSPIEPGPSATPLEWPEPEDIPNTLRPVEAFDPDVMLPEMIRPWVADIADRMQCAPDYPGVAAVTVTAALIGRKVGIYPKQSDDWQVIPNLWALLLGRPSELKSPALREVLKPLYQLEGDAREEYEFDLMDYSTAIKRQKVKMDAAVEGAKKAVKQGAGDAELDRIIKEAASGDVNEPVRRRYLTSDPTVEKLGELLNQNPDGLLLFRDEISGWIKTINREDRSNDRSFYLECWAGDGRYSYDRIGRGTIDIPSCTLSILGGIQPGKLSGLVRGALSGGMEDDGMVQRFQVAVYPDRRPFKIVDRKPDIAARTQAYNFFKSIAEMESPAGGTVPGLRFDDDAQAMFYGWLEALENEIRGDDIHPAMEAHLAKYRSLIPSLALIFHVAGGSRTSGPVGAESVAVALGWYEYLRSHAERIYGIAINNHNQGALTILSKIRSGKINSPFTKRDIQRGGWSGLTDQEDIDGALEVLLDYGHALAVTQGPGAAGGRPSTIYHVNPKSRG